LVLKWGEFWSVGFMVVRQISALVKHLTHYFFIKSIYLFLIDEKLTPSIYKRWG